MTASRLLDDIQKQADITAYLLELLDDEEIVRSVQFIRDCGCEICRYSRAGIDAYRDLLKQRLREGK